MTNPVEPTQGATSWYDWATFIDSSVRTLLTQVATLSPANGPVNTVNGVAPDVNGNVQLQASDVGAMPDTYAPSLADAVPYTVIVVPKDPTTGFWPSGYDPVTGAPIYTNGAPDVGVRPTARADIICDWQGLDPSPASVSSGTGGALRGVDRRSLPG